MRRGEIFNRLRAKQINDFTRLRYDNITPTDIDGLIEYHNKAYIIFEIKYNNAQLPDGQRIAFLRMINDFEKIGKKAICIISSHNVYDPAKDVDASEAIVTEYTENGRWQKPVNKYTLKEFVDNYIKFIG